MLDLMNITDFLEPLNIAVISNDEGYQEGQVGKMISCYEEHFPDLMNIDLVIVGCGEYRGELPGNAYLDAASEIRQAFYQLYYWHKDVRIADIGNIKKGAGLTDTYAALKTVLKELEDAGKMVVILGGSHDLALAQYYAFADKRNVVEAVTIDALIDIDMEAMQKSKQFLMEVLTSEPNYVKHYSHIGFQSYLVHPGMLETLDKLRFDCYRTGHVKENIEEMEPVFRNSHFMSFDISAIASAYAPANDLSPNGFSGEEACALMRFAGMSQQMKTIGIYGYHPNKDNNGLTAKQISHMLWYLVDGKSRGGKESPIEERSGFNEFHTVFSEVETSFLQSKRTGRWWMQLPDQQYIACSYNDYLLASTNEIPERWLRAQERSH